MGSAQRKARLMMPLLYYEPGYKAGGSVTTVANLVRGLRDEYEFRMAASDRDLGDRAPYGGIPGDRWLKREFGEIVYLSPGAGRLLRMAKLLRGDCYDILYLNSVFSPVFSIWPLALRLAGGIPNRPVVICPRGELGSAALGIKSAKKKLFLRFAAGIGLYRNVLWQASSPHEAEDIRERMGRGARIMMAPDLPARQAIIPPRTESKVQGELRIVFFSRIARIKNLSFAIRCLRNVRGTVLFDIYGPVEDRGYWEACRREMDMLPPNIDTTYRGALAPSQVQEVLGAYDLLLLPTEGEAFGHAILEAFMAGCPVLISDQTPWKQLEQAGIGWDVPLGQPERFEAVLQACADMGESSHGAMRRQAAAFAQQIGDDTMAKEAHLRLFEEAMTGGMAKGVQ